MKKKKIIWFEEDYEENNLSHEDALKLNKPIGTLWLVDADQPISELWGDDWDDAPASCNAGSPHEDKCRGLIKISLKLGEGINETKYIY